MLVRPALGPARSQDSFSTQGSASGLSQIHSLCSPQIIWNRISHEVRLLLMDSPLQANTESQLPQGSSSKECEGTWAPLPHSASPKAAFLSITGMPSLPLPITFPPPCLHWSKFFINSWTDPSTHSLNLLILEIRKRSHKRLE